MIQKLIERKKDLQHKKKVIKLQEKEIKLLQGIVKTLDEQIELSEQIIKGIGSQIEFYFNGLIKKEDLLEMATVIKDFNNFEEVRDEKIQ